VAANLPSNVTLDGNQAEEIAPTITITSLTPSPLATSAAAAAAADDDSSADDGTDDSET